MTRWWVLILLLLLGWLGVLAHNLGWFAKGEGLPAWNVAKYCATANNPDQCKSLESTAQKTIADVWTLLPASYRAACLAEMPKDNDQSFRALSQCIEKQAKSPSS